MMNKKHDKQEPEHEERAEGATPGRSPLDTIRYGVVSLGIWEEVNEKGTFFRAGRLTRSYQDEQGTWQTSFYLRETDLLDAALVCTDTFRRMSELRRERRVAERQGNGMQPAPNV